MNSPRDESASRGTEFDKLLEGVLCRYTGLICWTCGQQSPVQGVKDNGTFCFVQTDSRRFLVTCSHVWRGFQEARSDQTRLWLGFIPRDVPQSPSIPLLVENPTLIEEDTQLDLATITFAGIDSLESWRFYSLGVQRPVPVGHGLPACFVGFTGDGLRAGIQVATLNYSLFTLMVSDASRTGFLMHDTLGRRHLTDAAGRQISHGRVGGVSGSPVFSFDGKRGPWLAGILHRVSSPGLSGCDSPTGYEMSDGDFYASHVHFIQSDGSIRID